MTMRVGIQRRTIYLAPPEGMDLMWVSRFLENPEVTASFSLDEPVPAWHFRSLVSHGLCIVGVLRKVETRQRIGFACMFAPDAEEGRAWWEIGAAIEKPQHRDAFSMLNCVDAMSHYMFDHVGAETCGSRVREDNRASEAVGRRLGHRKVRVEDKDGHAHWMYVLNRDDWAARKARLDRGEAEHPSGTGGTFVTLQGPPYVPVVPSTAG